MHPIDKASILCTRESPHTASCVLPPMEGLEQEGVSHLCSFSSQDTFNQKQRCRVVVSGRDRILASGEPCRPPSSALHSPPAAAKWILKCTPKSLHDPKSQDTHQVIQTETMTSRRLPGRKDNKLSLLFKKSLYLRESCAIKESGTRTFPDHSCFTKA